MSDTFALCDMFLYYDEHGHCICFVALKYKILSDLKALNLTLGLSVRGRVGATNTLVLLYSCEFDPVNTFKTMVSVHTCFWEQGIFFFYCPYV